jgi:hypothetical protein
MIIKTNLRLGNLHCVTLTDRSGEDEPYLRVFFITIDGSNIRSNDPADGNYDVLLQIEAVLPNGSTMPVGSEPIIFDGQSIELPPDFAKNVRDCLENFVGTKWSKSKRLNPKDLWGPAARRQRYEQITNELDALATVGAFERAEVEAIKITSPPR